MRRIVNFVKFDFQSVLTYYKNIIYMLGLSLLVSILFNLVTGTVLLGMFIISVASYPFMLSERSRFFMLSGSLPIARRELANGRYGYAIVMNIGFLLISSVITVAVCVAKGSVGDISMYLLAILVVSLYIVFTISLQYVFLFKLGYAKSKIIITVPMISIFVAYSAFRAIIGSKTENVAEWLVANGGDFIKTAMSYVPLFFAAAVVVSALIYGGSIVISRRIYAKKEY